MTSKAKLYLTAAVCALALAIGSASLLGVDETLDLAKGLVGIAKEAKQ